MEENCLDLGTSKLALQDIKEVRMFCTECVRNVLSMNIGRKAISSVSFATLTKPREMSFLMSNLEVLTMADNKQTENRLLFNRKS